MSDYTRKSVPIICDYDRVVRPVSVKVHTFDGSFAADTFFTVSAAATIGGVRIVGYLAAADYAPNDGTRTGGIAFYVPGPDECRLMNAGCFPHDTPPADSVPVRFNRYGIRMDCDRSAARVYCANASTVGYGVKYARRGNWIRYETNNYGGHIGRVIGRIQCEGQEYIEAAVLSQSADSVFARWVMPADVRDILPGPPLRIFEFMSGAWESADSVMNVIHGGFHMPWIAKPESVA